MERIKSHFQLKRIENYKNKQINLEKKIKPIKIAKQYIDVKINTYIESDTPPSNSHLFIENCEEWRGIVKVITVIHP